MDRLIGEPGRPGLGAAWPELAAGLALLLILPFLHRLHLSHDIAWQLWVGRQILHGVGLYNPIVETNPPLWFWAGAAVVWLSSLAGVSAFVGLITFHVAITAASTCLLAVLVREHPRSQRAWLYAALGVASLCLLGREFGQREQWALFSAIPYVALIARRAAGLPVSQRLAVAVALFAATGLALKPHFALAPLLLEAWFLIAARPRWRPWRAEWFILALAAATYAAAVIRFTPDYLSSSVPLTMEAYSAFNARPIGLLESETSVPMLLSFAGVLLLRRLRSPVAAAALVAATGFFLGFVLQAKGWFYQGVPVTGLLLLAIGAEAPLLRWPELDLGQRAGAVLLGCAFLTPVILEAGLGFNVYHNRFRDDVFALTADLRPGQTVMALSSRATFIWPMVEERGLVWPSRYYTFWMLPAIARDRATGHPTAALTALADTVRVQTVREMLCHPPVRILVHDPTRDARDRELFGAGAFDYLSFFRENAEFRGLMAHYSAGPPGPWRTFDLVAPEGLGPIGPCRVIY